jgi:uncharacterized protein
MLNYDVDPALLARYVPAGTELDSFGGRTYVSLVGFRFLHTKLRGSLAVPLHGDFDEINLRFYVRKGDRRGVVFIAEIVPKLAVAKIARWAYGENYVCHPMRHRVEMSGDTKTAAYEWRLKGAWCRLHAQATGTPAAAEEGSLEQFITEHYWGYSARVEYHVAHEPWRVWSSADAGFEGDATGLYGLELGRVVQGRPDSAFIADGSAVVVYEGRRIRV